MKPYTLGDLEAEGWEAFARRMDRGLKCADRGEFTTAFNCFRVAAGFAMTREDEFRCRQLADEMQLKMNGGT